MKNFVVIDTETTNGLENPLVYDIGYVIFNEKNEVLRQRSFVISEIFRSELMETAYFIDKVPQYLEGLNNGTRLEVSILQAKKVFFEDCKTFNISIIMAHNALFDYRALQNTIRFITKSKSRYFFPSLVWYDTLKMARQTLYVSTTYNYYCKKFGFLTNQKKPKITAEVIHRYITGNNDFIESHTGLEDCLIEKDIYFKCLSMNARINCRLFS